jgi:hypothetical protein
MPTIVQLRTQPSEIVPLSALDTHDYVDAFRLEAPGAADATPENWARAALERTGLGGRLLWHGILRLRLDRSPGSIAGWKVGDRGQRWIRLEASSWCMSANVVVYVYDEQVAVATIVRYEHPVGAVVWAVMAPVHRRAVPVLLRAAAHTIEARRDAALSGEHR